VVREACPVCSGTELSELYRCPYTASPIRDFLDARYARIGTIDFGLLEGADYVLKECRGCGLIFQEQIPDEELSETVYERWADPEKAYLHKEKRALAGRVRNALEVMSIVDFFGRKPEDLRLLDFGMGWGFWVRIARAFGCQAFGLEVSASRVEHAREQGVETLSPERLDEYDFDFINTEQVFEHLPQPFETAVELAGRLRDGGVLKISVPNGMRVKQRLRNPDWTAAYGSSRSLKDVSPLQHINCFTHRTLLRLGHRAGLRPVEIPARLRYRYIPTWERPTRMVKRTVGQHYRAIRRQNTNIWFRRAS
jgi:2-polyprenyl-3-methyl-5-hydroxy-6-metoxy-1,4-benzoquinol methylase